MECLDEKSTSATPSDSRFDMWWEVKVLMCVWMVGGEVVCWVGVGEEMSRLCGECRGVDEK